MVCSTPRWSVPKVVHCITQMQHRLRHFIIDSSGIIVDVAKHTREDAVLQVGSSRRYNTPRHATHSQCNENKQGGSHPHNCRHWNKRAFYSSNLVCKREANHIPSTLLHSVATFTSRRYCYWILAFSWCLQFTYSTTWSSGASANLGALPTKNTRRRYQSPTLCSL